MLRLVDRQHWRGFLRRNDPLRCASGISIELLLPAGRFSAAAVRRVQGVPLRFAARDKYPWLVAGAVCAGSAVRTGEVVAASE